MYTGWLHSAALHSVFGWRGRPDVAEAYAHSTHRELDLISSIVFVLALSVSSNSNSGTRASSSGYWLSSKQAECLLLTSMVHRNRSMTVEKLKTNGGSGSDAQ